MSNDQGHQDAEAAEYKQPPGTEIDEATSITAVIRDVTQEWLKSERVSKVEFINDGECDRFAAEVLSRATAVDGLKDMNLADVLTGGVRDDDCDLGLPFNRELLAAEWPAVKPPGCLSWSDMDWISHSSIMPWGSWTHTWLTDGRLHYDAESPEGVDNFFELLIFQRLITAVFPRDVATEVVDQE
ncbi:hypothetical protein [Cupriavidus sp. CuC1]|uniref:hypothetical protein n=1 Tax=Cupriavidus sp. CuC1 TaxID=3373131 RepID=UPI0037D77830